MLIKPAQLREYGFQNYNIDCIKARLSMSGLDWKTFIKEGYDHTVLLAAAPNDLELKKFLKFFRLI